MLSDRDFDAFMRAPRITDPHQVTAAANWVPIAVSEINGMGGVLCLCRKLHGPDRVSVTWGSTGTDGRWFVDEAQDDMWFDTPECHQIELIGLWGLLGKSIAVAGRVAAGDVPIHVAVGADRASVDPAPSGAFVIALGIDERASSITLTWREDERIISIPPF